MTKKDYEDFKNSTKFWICYNTYVDTGVKVKDHCHITEKYGPFEQHIDCNINDTLCHQIPIAFHILKIYDPHLIMQWLDKFNVKINIIPNGLEKYMSFSISNFIHCFQFLSFSLDSLVKNLSKDDFNYLGQELDNNLLDLFKQKGFYPYEWFLEVRRRKVQQRKVL